MTIDLTRLTANTQTWAQSTSTADVSVTLNGTAQTLTGTAAAAYLFGQALTTVLFAGSSGGLALSDGRYEFPPSSGQRVALGEVADALKYKYGVDPIIEFCPGLGVRGVSVTDINAILATLNREFTGQFSLAAVQLDPVATASAGASFFRDVLTYLDGLKTKASGLAGFITARKTDAQVRAQRYAAEGLTDLKALALAKVARYETHLTEINQGIAAMEQLRTSALNGGTNFQAVIDAIKAQRAVPDVFAWLKSFDVDPSLLWDEGQAKVSFGDPAVVEGQSLVYRVVLSETPERTTDFSVEIDGSAAAEDLGAFTCSDGVTYNPATGKLTVPAGVSNFTITAPTVNDTASELTRTLTLKIAGAERTGTITDNDNLGVTTVSAEDGAQAAGTTDSSVTEGNALRYAVVLNAAAVRDTELTLSVSGTASADDYGTFTFSNGVTYDAASGKLLVPPGVSSFDITVPTIYNFANGQTDRTLTLAVGGVLSSAGTITDNPSIAVSTVTAADPLDGNAIFTEGKELEFKISLTEASQWPTEFSVAMAGSATSADYGSFEFSDGVVYNAQTGKILVPAGIKDFTATAPTFDNSVLQPSRILNLSIGGVTATATIKDAESPGQEGNKLRYAVTLSGAGEVPMKFILSVGSVTNSALPADYGPFVFSNGVTYETVAGNGGGTIIVPAGVTNFTITVPTVDDATDETTETLKLQLQGTGTSTGTVSASVNILDNDVITVASVSALQSQYGEGSTAIFRVNLSGTTANAVQFPLILDGEANTTSDFSGITFTNNVTRNGTTGTVTVPAGVSTFDIKFNTINDSLYEPKESLIVLLGDAPQASVYITDSDAPAVSSIVSAGVTEGDSLDFVVTLAQAADGPRTYLIQRKSGSNWLDAIAASDTDFLYVDATAVGATLVKPANNMPGYVTVPAGATSFTVKIPTKEDSSVEADETLVIRLLDRVNPEVSSGEGQGVVIDDDHPTVTSFTGPVATSTNITTVTESSGKQFSVYLSGVTKRPLELTLSATQYYNSLDLFNNTDYQIVPPATPSGFSYDAGTGKLTVPAGVSSFNFEIRALNDGVTENSEYGRLHLTSPTSTISGPVLRINDSDTSIDVQSVVPSAPVVYEGGRVEFTVDLSGVTVNTSSSAGMQAAFVFGGLASASDLSNISITNGVTYTVGSGGILALTVPDGVSDFKISADVVADSIDESGETVQLKLFNTNSNASPTVLSEPVAIKDRIAVTSVTGTNVVADTLGVSTLVATTDRVQEGGALSYAVTLSVTPDQDTSLPISITGTASSADYGALTFTNGVTYDAGAGTLRIPAGTASFTITIPTVADGLVESNPETLVLRVGGSGEPGRTLTATIADVIVAALFGVRTGDSAAYADPDRRPWDFAALDWSKSGWNINALNPGSINVSEVKAAIASFERDDLFGEFDWGRWKANTENLKTGLALTSDLWVTSAIPSSLQASGVVGGYTDSVVTTPVAPLSSAKRALLAARSNEVFTQATDTELRQSLTEGGDLYTDRFGAFYLNGLRTQAMDVAVTSRLLVQDNVSAEYKVLMDELAERNNLIAAARTVINAGANTLLGAVTSLAEQYGMDDVLSELTAGQYSDADVPVIKTATAQINTPPGANISAANNTVKFIPDPLWPNAAKVYVTARTSDNEGAGFWPNREYFVSKQTDGSYRFSEQGDMVSFVDIDAATASSTFSVFSPHEVRLPVDPAWTTGTCVQVSSSGGGLMAGEDYFVRALGSGRYSFFGSAANAKSTSAITGRIDLTAPITASITSTTSADDFTSITALLNTLISNKVRDGDLDQAKLQTLTAQLQNNTEAMTALIKAFTDMNAQLARAL